MDGGDLGDAVKPIYLFEWEDGTERRTDNLEHGNDAGGVAIENLAILGRDDPECEVTHVGYET